MPSSSESRIKALEKLVIDRQKGRTWAQSWSNAARAILKRIQLAEVEEAVREIRDHEDHEALQSDIRSRVPNWDKVKTHDWRKDIPLEELAAYIPANRPKLRAFIMQDRIEGRMLSFALTIEQWFRLGPDPGTGADPGIDEEELFLSIEKLMSIEQFDWDTPLPLVRKIKTTTR